MKRFFGGVIAMALLAVPGGASAQASLFASVGAGLPMGDYSDVANTGWMAQAGVAFPIGTAGLSAGANGFFGSNSHEPPPDGDKTNLYGALAFLQYVVGDPAALSGYVFAGPGYMTHSYKSETLAESSGSGLAASGGAGVNFPIGGIMGYAETMYLTGIGDEVDGLDLLVGSVGVSFPLGG